MFSLKTNVQEVIRLGFFIFFYFYIVCVTIWKITKIFTLCFTTVEQCSEGTYTKTNKTRKYYNTNYL